MCHFSFRSTELCELIYAGRLCLFLLSGNRRWVYQLWQGEYTCNIQSKSFPIDLGHEHQQMQSNAAKIQSKLDRKQLLMLGLFMLRRLSHLLVLSIQTFASPKPSWINILSFDGLFRRFIRALPASANGTKVARIDSATAGHPSSSPASTAPFPAIILSTLMKSVSLSLSLNEWMNWILLC